MNFNGLQDQVGRMNDLMQTQFMQTSQGLASVGYENLRNFSNTQDAVKDGNYALSRQMADCCCTTQRGIDSVNYNGAMNTSAIQQTVAEQTQKVLDAISGNRVADMQNQINQLQLQQALCGVVRYPQTFAYNAGPSPFCGGCVWRRPRTSDEGARRAHGLREDRLPEGIRGRAVKDSFAVRYSTPSEHV